MFFKTKIKSTMAKLSLGRAILDERQPFSASTQKLIGLKNAYAGERCFIIGNGPSLNKIDLDTLKNEHTFGVNGIFYKTEETGFRPSFFVVEDYHVMHDNIDRIDDYDVKLKLFPTAYKKLIRNRDNVVFFNMNTGYYNKSSDFYCMPRFSRDASRRVFCGQSVTTVNLQLAYHLGFTKVYLIGMDHTYVVPDSAVVTGETIESTEDDPNHFHPKYFGQGKKWHDPHLDRAERSYEYIKMAYEMDGRQVINATVGGKLEIFERADFMDVVSSVS